MGETALRALRARRWHVVAVVAVVAVVGLFGSLALTAAVERAQQRHAGQLMDQHADEVARAVVSESERYCDALADVAAALGAQSDLAAGAFTEVASRLGRQRLPGATDVGFAVPAGDDEVPEVQAFWRAHGAAGLTLTAAGKAPERMFLIFSRSLDGAPGTQGRDLSQAPPVAEALRMSRSSGQVTASQTYVLPAAQALPAAQQQRTFLLAAPVYGGPATREAGRFQGWMVMGVRGGDFMRGIMGSQSHAAVNATLLDLSTATPTIVAQPQINASSHAGALSRQRPVAVGRRNWQLRLEPTDALLMNTDRRLPAVTFAVGMLMTLLVAAIAAILVSARDRAVNAVDRATAALRQATRDASRLALVARHMDHGVVIADTEGRIEWVNDAFTQMNGYPLAEVIGRMRTELLGVDSLPAVDISALPDGGSLTLPDLETRTKDGQSRWLQVELYRVVDDDAVVWLVGVERDVTTQRSAERARLAAKARAEALARDLSVEKAVLAGIISSIPHLIYWKDTNGRYVGWNAAFLSMRDLPPGTDLTGRSEHESGVTDDLTPVLADLENRATAGGHAIVDHQVTVNGPDGVRNVLMSVLPQPDETGQISGLIGIGADVTHLSDLERQLNQANRLEAIGQLAAGIAHEINTPIQFISDNTRFVEQSFTQLLTLLEGIKEREGGARPSMTDLYPDIDVDFIVGEVPTALSESLEGLERVAQIVRAMKDFSHPGQGRQDVDINRAVQSTVQIARNEWKYHAELELRLGEDVGFVPCYEGEFKQVILNLIVNAAHAIEASGVRPGAGLGTIAISTTRTVDHVEIVIRDNGIGMDEATKLRIFDPFFTTKEVGKGTGQGLSMAYASIVQKHGGTIRVDSAPGAGTAFILGLPTQVPVPA